MKKEKCSKSRLEITVETERTFSIRSQKVTRAFCADCGTPVQMVTLEQATMITGMHWRAIYQALEAARIHFTETPEGLLLICLNSLTKQTTWQSKLLYPPG